jgi:uncharacterized protein
MPISPQLIQLLRQGFALDWGGIHGAPHWARVKANGIRLSESTGANVRVVEAFAFLHDSQRLNDDHDPHHGQRAAAFARTLPIALLDLTESEMDLLVAACEGHSEGVMNADITVCTCWDADRLDLGRVGIIPDPSRLCTEAARDPAIIRWAYARSIVD